MFMDYFESSDQAYATAGVLGAVASGKVQLLEALATDKREDFRLMELAEPRLDQDQLYIGFSNFPLDLCGYSSFHVFLFTTIEYRQLHSLKWLLNWSSAYDASASYTLLALSTAVDIWHTYAIQDHKFKCTDLTLFEKGKRDIDEYADGILDRFRVWHLYHSS